MNPDQALIHHFAAHPTAEPVRVDSNPMAQALRTRLARVDTELGLVELHFEPGDTFIQGKGVVQGGAVAAMLDFAMAFAALAKLDAQHTVATANLNVSFLRAALAGPLVAVGEVERAGRSLVFTQARLMDGQGRLIATASSTLPVMAVRAAS